ncbi:hypothetical protein AVEN_2753-1 [Araneus ventricosus]|uniref:Uncharacterized protein n=1 Tax=Araneus ventricosus TaxID=182803 RepID=A0A4Y2I0J6_ARAVE|nr:hypothetical protein AVEN_2753-1 [Araneus ventricosus]
MSTVGETKGKNFIEVEHENNELKRANQQLKKKNITQERSIANYEVKLAQCMTDLIAAKKELEEAEKTNKSYEMENADLKCHVNQIEGELSQYRGLKLRNNEENQKMHELEKTISVKIESIRRLKKNSAAYRLQLVKKDALLKKLQHHNRQILSLVVEFGCKLTEAGLLTKNYTMDILQKYQEEYFTLKTSESIGGNDDLPQITPGILKTSLGHKEQADSNNFDSCIGDQNVTSSVVSPPPSLVSSSEISSSVYKNIDTFQTQLHNLSKKNKPQKKFSDSKNTELEQTYNFGISPDTSDFVNEICDCDLSKRNQKLFAQDLQLPTNSADPIAMDNYSQIDLTDSNDESDISEVEDLQNDSSAKNGKDLYKNSDAISTTLSGKCIPLSCIEKFSFISTNIATNNQNIKFHLSSFQPKGDEVTSTNIISSASFQNELMNNMSAKQEISKKKLSLPSLADDTEQDKFYELLPETVSHEKETIDPDKQGKVGSFPLKKQNFCINQEENVFRTAEVSSCNNILIPLSRSKIPVQEEKIKSYIEQTSSISTSTEKEFLPAMSMPLIENSQHEEPNCCITPESVLKNNTILKQCPLNELGKLITNESHISDTSIQRTNLENEILTFDNFNLSITNNLELDSDFEKTTSFLQDEQSLSDNESNVSDEFSKFENLLNVLNPISPLPPSPIKNSKLFNNESILSRNLEEIGEDPQTSQLSSVPKSVKDQLLVIEKDQCLSYAKDDIFQSCTSVSHKSFVFESHEDLEFDAKPKFVDQCNSLDGDTVNPLVCERQDVTSDIILCPKLCECYVSLSRCDIPKYFSSVRKQTSSQMLSYNQSSCKSFIPESSNLISSRKTNDLVPDDSNYKTAANANDDVNNRCKKAEIKSLSRSQTFSENESNIKCDHEVSAEKSFSTFDVKNMASPSQLIPLNKSSNSHKELPLDDIIINAVLCTKDYSECSEMENSHESSSSNIIINEASALNVIESSTSRKQNNMNRSLNSKTRECYVSLSRSDVPNYFLNLKNQTPSQIVDYYNNHLTNSVFRNPNSVSLFGKIDNNSVSHDDRMLSAQMKCADNMQHKIGKINYTSDSEIFFENETNSVCDLLEKPSNLPKIKAAVPFVSSQSVVAPSNTVMKNSSLNTIDSLCLAESFCLTECENYHESSKRLENISEDICLSNIMTPSEREKEISNKILSGNLRECYVSLSRNDISNYFLSIRRESMFQATENKQTTFSCLMTNISDLVTSSKREKTSESVMNDSDTTTFMDIDHETNVNCNSIHHEANEIGINTSAIPTDLRNESNSSIIHEILPDKSSNLLKGKTLALPNESDKLISCFNIVENSFKSQSLPSIKSYAPLFDDNDTSDIIKSVDKKLDVPLSQNSSDAEIGHKDLSAIPVELTINHLNKKFLKSFKPQNCSLLKSYAPSSDANCTVDRIKLVNKKLPVPVSQNSSGAEIHHEVLSTDSVELPLNNFNQNSVTASRSENCSLAVTAFQNSSDTETFHDDLSSEFVELPIKSDHQKCSMKRKRSKSSDCNFSEKTSLTKWCRDFIDSKPLFKKRSTLLLPGPSVPTKWKKSSILNQDSLPSERKKIQTEMHIPTCLTPEFQKKCSSVIEKNSLKKKIKPLDSGMTWVAPVRLRGRTSKSKAFVKMSCNKHINNGRDSSSLLNKEVEFSLMPPTHEENIENYTSVKPPKIRKQCKKKASSEVHIFSNVSEASSNLLEQPISSQEENQLATKPTPKHRKPSTSSKIFFDFLQKHTSAKHGIVHSKEIIDKQVPFNKTECNLKNEESVETLLDNDSLNSGGCNEDFSCRKKAFSDSVAKINHISSEDFMKNIFSNVSRSASQISSNSLEQPIPSQTDFQVSRVKPTPEHLQQCKKITATTVFFDFLHKQNSTKYKIDHIKEFIDKQLSTNKTESKLKYESKRQSVNETKSKLKNKSKKLSVNKTKSKLKNESKKLSVNKIENKLKNENKSLSVNKTKRKLKNKRKKRFNSDLSPKLKMEKLESNEEINPTISSPVSDVLHGIESIHITDEQFKQYIHSLTIFLTNPLHTPDMANLIYHVVNFLHLTRENYLINSSKNNSAYCFLTSAESCIVEALFCIQNDSNLHMQCLTKTVLHILHQLVLTKVKFHIYGLASLCRVLAEICKRSDDGAEALSLCCNILKVKHPFGPYLIASIVAVWKELFMMSDSMSEEEILLLRSISFGAQKKPQRVSKSNWNFSFELLTGLVPSVPDANKAIEFLKNRILIKCLENTFEELWRLTSPFLILVAHMPWDWIKMHIIDMYVIPNLQRFSRHASKEKAFDLFCNLCVEVLLLNRELDDDKVLNIFYENISLTGRNFVRDCVAISLMKYFILSKRTVPPFLEVWFKHNQDNPKVQVFENIFHQRLMSEHQELLTKQDIVI